MPRTLWAKGEALDARIHSFTVGDDPISDLALLPFDCLASAAHVKSLLSAGLLTRTEAASLLVELGKLKSASGQGQLTIPNELEDGHTLLEAKLTEALGETGARIHLGRSRNEQVALALRLWMRDAVLQLGEATTGLATALLDFSDRLGNAPLPGLTHLRRAMPSSFGLWAEAYAEALLEELEALKALDRRLDRSPAHSAAGFGTPLPFRLEEAAARLGFSRIHRNPLDVQNGRGRQEGALLAWLTSLSLTLEKLAWDGCLYGSEGFAFLHLPNGFTTGSSLMPQKRNPDVLELIRGRCREIRGLGSLVERVAGGLPSSYHRDFQLLKKPLMEGVRIGLAVLQVMTRVVDGFEPDLSAAKDACTDELYAANEAFRLSRNGLPFRHAYRAIADQREKGSFHPDREAAGPPDVWPLAAAAREELAEAEAWLATRRLESARIESTLFLECP